MTRELSFRVSNGNPSYFVYPLHTLQPESSSASLLNSILNLRFCSLEPTLGASFNSRSITLSDGGDRAWFSQKPSTLSKQNCLFYLTAFEFERIN